MYQPRWWDVIAPRTSELGDQRSLAAVAWVPLPLWRGRSRDLNPRQLDGCTSLLSRATARKGPAPEHLRQRHQQALELSADGERVSPRARVGPWLPISSISASTVVGCPSGHRAAVVSCPKGGWCLLDSSKRRSGWTSAAIRRAGASAAEQPHRPRSRGCPSRTGARTECTGSGTTAFRAAHLEKARLGGLARAQPSDESDRWRDARFPRGAGRSQPTTRGSSGDEIRTRERRRPDPSA
jgi:hypothetical protein